MLACGRNVRFCLFAKIHLGIDVSHYQGKIDWAAVAHSGIQFAFLKATEGCGPADSRFRENWAAAGAAGILRGAYHFFHPAQDIGAQTGIFLRTLQAVSPGELPPVLDLEVPHEWIAYGCVKRAAMILNWLDTVQERLGTTPIAYLNPSFGPDVLGAAAPVALARFPLWVAHYTAGSRPSVPKPWDSWTFWQHTSTGTVDGISGIVDLDYFNGSEDDLRCLAGYRRPTSHITAESTTLTNMHVISGK